jgi:hypothetical protein
MMKQKMLQKWDKNVRIKAISVTRSAGLMNEAVPGSETLRSFNQNRNNERYRTYVSLQLFYVPYYQKKKEYNIILYVLSTEIRH